MTYCLLKPVYLHHYSVIWYSYGKIPSPFTDNNTAIFQNQHTVGLYKMCSAQHQMRRLAAWPGPGGRRPNLHRPLCDPDQQASEVTDMLGNAFQQRSDGLYSRIYSAWFQRVPVDRGKWKLLSDVSSGARAYSSVIQKLLWNTRINSQCVEASS